ncbi:hypothetical protein ACGFYU_04275 [Streptomyces sp. NPDC048337]|uniref:hypothetical protein n=1 Tax=Streptomyces sp. NPDC048337 TaxID=3365535 RepID=UPI00371DCC37
MAKKMTQEEWRAFVSPSTRTGKPSTFAYVVLQGRAEISEDPDELLTWATAIGARYMGEERAEAFGRRNAVPGELLVRVPIDKVIAISGISD